MSSAAAAAPSQTIDGWSRVSRRLAAAARNTDRMAVLLVYLQGIERLCATLGHQASEAMLADLHARLTRMAHGKGAAERLTDRKFAVMLGGLRNAGHVRLAAQKIERLLASSSVAGFEQSGLTPTIGIVLLPEHGNDPHELLRLAEIALLDGLRRKESPCFYEPESAEQLYRDWDLEGRLGDAIEGGDLELHYQPKLCLKSDRIVGAEALMRWTDAELGPISPEVFINLAESTGQIVELTHFAVQRACRQLSQWPSIAQDLNVAINVTPTIIQSTEIVDTIGAASSIWGVDPSRVTIEVTENSLMANRETSHGVLTAIRELGSRVSIDDFGTGYSSLSYLKEIPADELKIDRSFVMGMLNDPGDRKIVEHTIGLASSFGLEVVAEGIESAAMLEALRRLGCHVAQGYFICKPLPPAEFAAFAAAHHEPAGAVSSAVSATR